MQIASPDSFYIVGKHILDVLKACLVEQGMECGPDGTPMDFFYSHDRPPDDCCNFIAVWLGRVRPGIVDEFPDTTGRLLRRCEPLGLIADFNITFRRHCFPIPTDQDFFPSIAEIDCASKELSRYMSTMFCCIISSWESGELTGITPPGSPEIEGVSFGEFLPRAPRGGCGGWDGRLTVEIGRCC